MNWFEPTAHEDGFREVLRFASVFYVRVYGLLVVALVAGSVLWRGWRKMRREESDGK
jgi:hypothetical protein